MATVVIDISEYNYLKSTSDKNRKRADALENELAEAKSSFEKKLNDFVEGVLNDGSVMCLRKTIVYSADDVHTSKEVITGVTGFDEVREEVYEHFKQGLFDEQLAYERKMLEELIQRHIVNDHDNENLKDEIRRLKSRSLWERIINK